MKTTFRAPGVGAIEMVEEAVHLLRCAPASLLAIYAIGTLPFVLAFLYFWADMSRGAYAREHAGSSAAAMGLLYLWMKCWQAVFSSGLRARITGHAQQPWTVRRAARLALAQIALQPSGLFVVPGALIIILPSAWVFNFYQNLTAIGGDDGSLGDTFKTASRQASIRPGQNLFLLGILSVFTFFVWVNVVMGMAWLPGMLRTIFGIDSAFTQAGAVGVLNTTFLACSVALAWVFVDPLIKSVYVLRCFYGQSLHSGDDLKAELARVSAPASGSMAALAALVWFCAQSPVSAAVDAAPTDVRPTAAAVSPSQLDQSITEVLKERQFAWRMPREKLNEADNKQQGWVARAAQAVVDALSDAMKAIGHALGKAWEWIVDMARKLWPQQASRDTGPFGWGSGWMTSVQYLLLFLILGVAGFLTLLIIRAVRRRRKPHVVVADAVAARPDLNDENVAANQLPEDGWLNMARELMQQGNLRLALRAFYLASLAHLAARELIAIAIFKSNREYEMELRRRARALPEVQSAFSQNVAVFDRAWYGLHEVTQEALQQFQSNLERIREC